MKTSTRSLLGAVLLSLSIVCPSALAQLGVAGRMESHTEPPESTTLFNSKLTVYSTTVTAESPLWVNVGALCVAGVGLLLLVWPRRDKTDA